MRNRFSGLWYAGLLSMLLGVGAAAQDAEEALSERPEVDGGVIEALSAPLLERALNTVSPTLPAAPPARAEAPFDPLAVPEMTAHDVSAWLDGYMPYALATGDIVGAVVAVVKDGEVLVNNGYGYADLDARTLVDPEQTLFRPGSISKLFTWTAVMQLVERGELDLDADVTRYLDFDLPTRRGAITLRHIMTHTTGFEEVLRDLILPLEMASDASLRDYLAENVPSQIYSPGEMPAYSNYATALAGYIVERTSGEAFDDYVEHHILAPLGMTQSSFHQPLPSALAGQMSTAYKSASDGEPQPFEVVTASPAGALSSTSADMARFMIAHLSGGTGVLRPETTRAMHTTIDAQFPPLNAMALGFYQQNRNGLRIVAHGGDTQFFHSDLVLVLDEGVGLFISVNSGGSGMANWNIRQQLFESFIDRYFPAEGEEPERLATALEHGQAIVGAYESSRRPATNGFAALQLLMPATVSLNEDGDIVAPLMPDVNAAPKVFREVEPWVWRHVGGQDRLTARIVDGRVEAVAFEPLSFAIEFTPIPAWRSPSVLVPAFSAALFVFIVTALAWPIRAFARWRLAAAFPYSGARAMAYRVAPIAALTLVAYPAAWAGYFVWALSGLSNLSDAGAGWLGLLYATSVIAVIAPAALIWATVVLWREPSSWFARTWAGVLVAAALVILWAAVAGRLFSFDLTF